jgi:hypothetical protein
LERGGSATSSSSLACMTALVGDQQLRLKKKQAKFGNRNVRRDAIGVESICVCETRKDEGRAVMKNILTMQFFCPQSGSAGRGGPSYGR